MTTQELIEEFTDCHDKERQKYIKEEIDKRVKQYIARCFDYQMEFISS